ncbi:MAG: LysR family transcriptional regulator [Pseudomonadota bacterium]
MSILDWEALKSFLAVAEDGSLSRAATRLDVSVATLGRRIDDLEAEIGFKLIRRGPRGTTTTPEGQRIADLIMPGAEYFCELDRLVRVMANGVDRPPIRVSSTEPMIADVLAPKTPALLSEHPHIKIEFETSLELSDLNRGEADIAIRMVKPSGDTLITRRLPKIRIGLFAAASYLKEKSTRIDLRSESLLWYDSAYGDIAENLWLKRERLEDQVVIRSGSVRALCQAALAGCGIAPLPSFLATKMGLLPIAGVQLPDRTPWLVFHRDTRHHPQQKIVRDWIETACKEAILVE